jgi:Protein of unknown function (DUF2782)
MGNRMRKLALLSVLLLVSPTWAQPRLPQPPPPPEIPPSAAPEEAIPELPGEAGVEPEVTIIQRGQVTIQEFRVNGRLRMIKVIPRWGFPYYLVPTSQGVWDSRLNGLAPIAPPQWLLFSW